MTVGLAACDMNDRTARDTQVRNDVATLVNALAMYRLNAGHFPSTAQGLAALVDKPTGDPVPERWTKLCERMPLDPWGAPYQYRREREETKKDPGYDLWSMGKDGVSGTRDDIHPLLED
ncbi:MAG: type II secretion system major pseudopilin GspG [Verrucomicrobia bacterium]|nr:type II secretion system major pseudopilin GspG [Verrucomicrobiota bacterium]